MMITDTISPRNHLISGGEFSLIPISFKPVSSVSLFVGIFCVFPLSGGHLNIAVSASFLVTKAITVVEFIIYVVA